MRNLSNILFQQPADDILRRRTEVELVAAGEAFLTTTRGMLWEIHSSLPARPSFDEKRGRTMNAFEILACVVLAALLLEILGLILRNRR